MEIWKTILDHKMNLGHRAHLEEGMYAWLISLRMYLKDGASRYEKIMMGCWKHLKNLGLRGNIGNPRKPKI